MTTALITPSRLPRPREPARASRAGRAAAGDPRRARGRGLRLPGAGRGAAGERRRRSCARIRRRYLAALAGARRRRRGCAAIDGDTFLSPGIARRAARRGGGRGGAGGRHGDGRARSRNAFCAVRPPGHHAETATAMGFCLFGNVVIGARHALEAHGLERVAIVDFDVHHGNGTQDLVWDDARILLRLDPPDAALSRDRRAPTRRGAHGQIVNVPLPPGASGGGVPRRRCSSRVLPAVEAHRAGDDPDLGRLRRPRPRSAGEPGR